MPTVTDLRDRVRGWFRRAPKSVAPRMILVVDGNAAKRQSTAALIAQLGYEPRQAPSIAEALRQLETEDPEFILLSFELDDADGLGALSQIRELDAQVPIVMLAADLWDARVSEAMRRGAVAYIAPPFGAHDLRELFGRR